MFLSPYSQGEGRKVADRINRLCSYQRITIQNKGKQKPNGTDDRRNHRSGEQVERYHKGDDGDCPKVGEDERRADGAVEGNDE